MAPKLIDIDHIHIFVADRRGAEAWYARVLGLKRSPELEVWATQGGPLTLRNEDGSVHLALFERPTTPCRGTVALRTSRLGFEQWREHLEALLPGAVEFEDHQLSHSLYFADPDGNPFEVTTYEVSQQ